MITIDVMGAGEYEALKLEIFELRKRIMRLETSMAPNKVYGELESLQAKESINNREIKSLEQQFHGVWRCDNGHIVEIRRFDPTTGIHYAGFLTDKVETHRFDMNGIELNVGVKLMRNLSVECDTSEQL